MPQYSIEGYDLQYLKATLNHGETIYADAGHMVGKDKSVQLKTKMQGGLFGALKRRLTGETFFVTEFAGPGDVYLSGIFPGRIVQIPLRGNGILVESHSFLAIEPSVSYDVKLTKLSVGWLGGEGYFLAKFHGTGNVFLHAYGEAIEKYLDEGETLQVEASHLLAFEDGMKYGVQTVGGLRSMLFAHEGLFLVTIQGPGRVWLHTLTIEQLVSALLPFFPQEGQK